MSINRRLPVVGGGGGDTSAIEADITTLDGRVDTAETDINAVESTVATHTSTLTTVGQRLDTFDGISNIGNVSSTLTVTPGLGNGGIKQITLTAPVLTISFNTGLGDKLNSLELVITQDATGGRTIVWNETVKWPGGLEPILSTEPGAIDRILFTSYDGGATWFGDTIGLAYA